jgi:metal-dependent amidase/aminoacylase/carboxypeptidase family protein
VISGTDNILAGYESLPAGQEALYKDLHQHPELSHAEHRTARRVAGELSSTYTREPSYLTGRVGALDARLEDAHMGYSMQTKAWASDADQGIGQ